MALFKPDLVLRANSSVARPRMGCEDGDAGKPARRRDADARDKLARIQSTGRIASHEAENGT
jgi:hypothetical protein